MSSRTTATEPYRLAADQGLASVWFKTGRLAVKAGRAETGGCFSQFETDDPRGTATALHVHHNEDETFYVLEGEVTVQVGEERYDLAAGDYAFAPRDVPHAYAVRSARARMLVTLCPGGLEELFVTSGIPVTGDTPPAEEALPSPEEIARVFGERGIEVVGPPLVVDEL
jgi:quercetin dioxygenase-like cupin family protein